MYSVLGNHKTMTHRYTVNVIHVYNRIIVHTQQHGIVPLGVPYKLHFAKLKSAY